MCNPGKTPESLQPLGQSSLTERTRLAGVAEMGEEERPLSSSWEPSSDTDCLPDCAPVGTGLRLFV